MKKSLASLWKAASAAVFISFLFIAPAGAGPANGIVREPGERVRVLAAGSDSGIEEPFVFVARTRAALEALGGIVQLPEGASDTDFNKAAIVAAFRARSVPAGSPSGSKWSTGI